MFKQSRFVFLTVTLLLVFFVSLARPMAVYADDSAPPPPTEEPANPPTEEAPVETESAPTEAPSEPSATETPTEPATESEPVVVSEILEAAPEGTEVVVLDENSEVRTAGFTGSCGDRRHSLTPCGVQWERTARGVPVVLPTSPVLRL